MVWREDEAGVVYTDVAVFGVEVCDAIIGVPDVDYFPRSTDGCIRVGSASHWFWPAAGLSGEEKAAGEDGTAGTG